MNYDLFRCKEPWTTNTAEIPEVQQDSHRSLECEKSGLANQQRKDRVSCLSVLEETAVPLPNFLYKNTFQMHQRSKCKILNPRIIKGIKVSTFVILVQRRPFREWHKPKRHDEIY